MLLSEKISILVFVSLVLTVYASAAWLAIESLTRWLRGDANSLSRRYCLLRRAVFGLGGLGLLCIAYGYFIEPYWVEVTHVRIETSKLPKAARPIRIAHISDLHSDPSPRLEERLPELIANEHPDLIVFSGDTLNSRQALETARRCLTRLAAIAPTFVVRGNWDVWFWSQLDLFGGTGVRELNGEAVKVKVRESEIWLAGAPVEDSGKIRDALEALPPEAFTVFLHHYPGEIETVAQRKVDLYCAGHTHGGQVALPFYGALITLSRFGKRFEAGLYRVDETWLYVNRGIGMEGGHAPRVRFWARPEVTVIDVVGSM